MGDADYQNQLELDMMSELQHKSRQALLDGEGEPGFFEWFNMPDHEGYTGRLVGDKFHYQNAAGIYGYAIATHVRDDIYAVIGTSGILGQVLTGSRRYRRATNPREGEVADGI